ncbi:MAG: hypothetical protein H7330_00885 [Hymenobacteraceae bacterium]|nr:hypothetical protein [Hymenobacteraceae bacterium]
MKRNLSLCFGALLVGILAAAPVARAQKAPPEGSRAKWLLDAAVGVSIRAPGLRDGSSYKQTQLNAAGWRLWPIGARERLRLGIGPRLMYSRAPYLVLERADRQTSYQECQRIYNSTNPGGLTLSDVQLTTLNLALAAQWRPVPWLRVGFNIDAIGVRLLASQRRASAIYPIANALDPVILVGEDFVAHHAAPDARAQRGNLLLVGRNDRGYLNSEFYLGFDLHHGFDVRIGRNHIVTNYVAEGRRFQVFQNLGFVGLSYELPPGKN